MPSEMERTTAKRILAVMAISVHWRFCCTPRQAYDVNAKYSGTLRESMVKVIHSVSAMEYRDAHVEPIVFRQFQNVGQFPFLDPSVLFFYVSEFELLGVRGWCDVKVCTCMCLWPASNCYG